MLLLRYNKYDESTNEYETGDIANVDIDERNPQVGLKATIYTENGSWYLTLNQKDIELLYNTLAPLIDEILCPLHQKPVTYPTKHQHVHLRDVRTGRKR